MKVVVSVAGERIGIASLGQPGDYCVGRHGGSSLHLSHPTVSAHHATLRWDGASVEVLDSTAGERSWLNGKHFAGWQRWSPGIELRLGGVLLALDAEGTDDGWFAVSLSPTQGPLAPDETLAATMPLQALAAPRRMEAGQVWEPWLAASAASVAAAAAAWIALFW